MVKYQGKEITATLQAPNKAQLNKLISGLNCYAKKNNLERVKVLSKGKDPDGGYKAIIEAHNFNPMSAIRDKWAMRLTSDEKLIVQRQNHIIRMERLRQKKERLQAKREVVQAKQAVAEEKHELAQARLKTTRVQGRTKQIKQRSKPRAMLREFLDFNPYTQPAKYKFVKYGVVANKPRTKARKRATTPRIITIRV